MITKWCEAWVEFDPKEFRVLRNLSPEEIEQHKKQMILDWMQYKSRQLAIEAGYISSVNYDFIIQLRFAP